MGALSDVHSLVNALYFLTLTLPTLPPIDRYKRSMSLRHRPLALG